MDQSKLLGAEVFEKPGRYWIKNFEDIGRDFKDVILLDHDANSYERYIKNTVPIKKFEGEDDDKELSELTSILTSLSKVKDVRTVIEKVNSKIIEKSKKAHKTIKHRIFVFVSFIFCVAIYHSEIWAPWGIFMDDKSYQQYELIRKKEEFRDQLTDYQSNLIIFHHNHWVRDMMLEKVEYENTESIHL